MCKFYSIVFAIFTLEAVNSGRSSDFHLAKNYHEAQELSVDNITALAGLTDLNHFNTVLDAILIPRVVGTPDHEKVADYITKQMKDLGWDVEEDKFADHTPVFGLLNFKNIIARLNPNAERFLVLACHYDSKYTREHVFVGATDSAVPCAMMLNLAKVMSKQLNEAKSNADLSLAFIFFDGEEAFRQWGPTDSIYGARHLARRWENEPYPSDNSVGTNHLNRIDVLVLLDLLGAPDPAFYSFFQATEKWYVRLASAEQRLADANLFTAYSRGKPEQKYFRLRSTRAYIEDDHLPFLRKNVNVLHVIPNPFPEVWHTAQDNRDALDFNTIDNLNKIFRVFVAEYLHLKP